MAYSANKLRAQSKRGLVDFDPDVTTAVVATLNPADSVKCLPLSLGIIGLLVGVVRTVGTGTISALRIIASDAADGTGNVAAVAAHAIGSAPNAVGDTVWLECTGEQIRAASATAQYVGVELTLATGTDECIVYFEASLRDKADELTADYIS